MGIEATLSWPSPDLVVYNDTKSAILIRNEYDDRRIRVRLFGDREGRRVERRVSAPFDLTDPRVEYEPDAEREPDDEKVVDKGSNGFSVAVTRVVHLATGDKREERRTIRYRPKPRVVRVHPCKIPKGEPGHTGDRCPEPSTLDKAGDGGSMMQP